MRLYSETFKKSVVKKVLSEGVVMVKVARKLNISKGTVRRWIKLYKDEVEPDSPVLDTIVEECREVVDIDMLLEEAARVGILADSRGLPASNAVFKQNKQPEQYSLQERLIIVETFKQLPEKERGRWLRTNGLYKRYIQLWEEEVFSMAKKRAKESDELKKLQEENRRLKKQLKESQRNEAELKILVELKKKYRELFEDNGED